MSLNYCGFVLIVQGVVMCVGNAAYIAVV